jgi:hypothetical protein
MTAPEYGLASLQYGDRCDPDHHTELLPKFAADPVRRSALSTDAPDGLREPTLRRPDALRFMANVELEQLADLGLTPEAG